jgi:hypothetical protein
MKPILVMNPARDAIFAAFAQILVDHGAASIEDLERRLRTVYPGAAVHARELAGETFVIWYVYRDGHWVDAPTVADKTGGLENDGRSARGSSIDRGIDPSRR